VSSKSPLSKTVKNTGTRKILESVRLLGRFIT